MTVRGRTKIHIPVFQSEVHGMSSEISCRASRSPWTQPRSRSRQSSGSRVPTAGSRWVRSKCRTEDVSSEASAEMQEMKHHSSRVVRFYRSSELCSACGAPFAVRCREPAVSRRGTLGPCFWHSVRPPCSGWSRGGGGRLEAVPPRLSQ